MLFAELHDLESEITNHVLITTGGQQVDVPGDESLSKALVSLWEQLRIYDIEL